MTTSPSSPIDPPDPPSLSSPPSPTDPGAADADADRLAAASPTTPAAELARIAAARPDLHPALATNPATYPDLVDWLRTSPDPAVQAALAQRTTPPAQPEPAQAEPAQAAQAQAEAPARATNAPTNPPPAGAPAPATKTGRRTGLPRPAVIAAVVLVTVLVLSGAAWAGIRFLNSKDHSRRASRPTTASAPEPSESPSPSLPEGGMVVPDSSWADGAHEVWSLEGGEKTSLILSGGQLFIITISADSSHADSVTAYSISGSEPKEQWEVQLHDKKLGPSGVWGDYFFIDDQLIERSSGRVMEAPWSTKASFLLVINDMAVTCDEKDNCEAWRSSDPFSRAWNATVKDSQYRLTLSSLQLISRASIHVGDRTILALSPKMLVDVDTGETFDLSAEDYDGVMATTDGWIADKGGSEYTILSPTGEKKGTFSGNNDRDERFGPTPSQERPSSEQYRKYLEDGDLSWAELRMSIPSGNTSSGTCPVNVTVGNNTMKMFHQVIDTAHCLKYPAAFVVSDDKRVVMAIADAPLSPESALIKGTWSATAQWEITFPGLDAKQSSLYLAGPSLIIASDRTSGKITAYAPGAN